MQRLSWTVVAVSVSVALAGCQSAGSRPDPAAGAAGTRAPGSGAAPSPSAVAVPEASLDVAPAKGATKVRPDADVTVTASSGRLETVSVTDDDGAEVPGSVKGGTTWRSSPGALKGGARYTVKATAVGADGAAVTRTSSFSTMTPRATNRAVLVPGDDWTVGVGMPVVVTFARAVKNRKGVEKAVTVTSTPEVAGAWRWMNDRELQWRPAKYWPTGTKVSVRAALGGVETSPGVWGKRTVTTAFGVGPAQISTVDVAKHTMTVRRNGTVLRTIPVTTGKKGFLTRAGTKVVMSREAQVRMDAATTGTDPKDPEYYDIQVRWALRLTYSGEFLHAAPWSVASQGRRNVSHGCTGMSTANAKWLFDNSRVGDVVVYKGSPRPLEWGNGYTVWNKTFGDWESGV